MLAHTVAVVAGVGAIGRQVALMLASMNVGELRLIDPDTVGVENLAAQGYTESDIELPKTEATGSACIERNSAISIRGYSQKFVSAHLSVHDPDKRLAVFACVDAMSARKTIKKAAQRRNAFFVDGRMGPEVARVLAAYGFNDYAYYNSTLFSDTEMLQVRCTAKTTLYCANICAGLMVHQMTRWLRGYPIDKDTLFNLLASEITLNVDSGQTARTA